MRPDVPAGRGSAEVDPVIGAGAGTAACGRSIAGRSVRAITGSLGCATGGSAGGAAGVAAAGSAAAVGGAGGA